MGQIRSLARSSPQKNLRCIENVDHEPRTLPSSRRWLATANRSATRCSTWNTVWVSKPCCEICLRTCGYSPWALHSGATCGLFQTSEDYSSCSHRRFYVVSCATATRGHSGKSGMLQGEHVVLWAGDDSALIYVTNRK